MVAVDKDIFVKSKKGNIIITILEEEVVEGQPEVRAIRPNQYKIHQAVRILS